MFLGCVSFGVDGGEGEVREYLQVFVFGSNYRRGGEESKVITIKF
jgi:hypothetical protein